MGSKLEIYNMMTTENKLCSQLDIEVNTMQVERQDLVTFPENDICYNIPRSHIGNFKSTKSIAECLITYNCKNKIGNLNYNENGTKGWKLEQIETIFCDNFLVAIQTPALMLGKTRKSNKAVSAQNSLINSRLRIFGIDRCDVTAVDIVNNKEPDGDFLQVFKLSCPETSPDIILEMLKNEKFTKSAIDKEDPYSTIIFRDIDFTLDFAGSFDKEDLKHHVDNPIDNNDTVGRNCLTWINDQNTIKTRCKIYNKFVQSLESGSVRSRTGNHLWNWVNNPHSGMRDRIPKSLEYGYTRFEVTFYDDIPTFEEVEESIQDILKQFPEGIWYKTPIREQWKSFCNRLEHNLIVYCPENNETTVAYAHNELTNKISGFYNCWKKASDLHYTWILSELTLNKPIDVFYLDWDKTTDMVKVGIRSFLKQDFPTRLTSPGSIFKHLSKSPTPAEMGLIPHNGISFYVADAKSNKASKTRAEFEEISNRVIDPVLTCPRQKATNKITKAKKDSKIEKLELRKQINARKQELYNNRKTVLKQQKKLYKQVYTRTFRKLQCMKKVQRLEIFSIGKSGDKLILGGLMRYAIHVDGNSFIKRLQINILNKSKIEKFIMNGREVYYEPNGLPIFTLSVTAATQKGYFNYCPFPNKDILRDGVILDTNEILDTTISEEKEPEDIPTLELPAKTKLANVNKLDNGFKANVDAFSNITYRGVQTYAFLLDGNWYRANYWAKLKWEASNKKQPLFFVTMRVKPTPTRKQEMNVDFI